MAENREPDHVLHDQVVHYKDHSEIATPCSLDFKTEPDHLMHLVLTWADAGQLHSGGTWRDRSIYRRGVALPLAAQLAVCTMNALGMIGPNLRITDAGSDLLAEWDALVAGEPEPVQPPVGTPT